MPVLLEIECQQEIKTGKKIDDLKAEIRDHTKRIHNLQDMQMAVTGLRKDIDTKADTQDIQDVQSTIQAYVLKSDFRDLCELVNDKVEYLDFKKLKDKSERNERLISDA